MITRGQIHILITSEVVVVRSDSGIDDFAGLKGKHVEVQTDSSALAALEGNQKDLAATFADLNQVAEYNTAFMDMESGACDAIAMDIGVANYQVNSRKIRMIIRSWIKKFHLNSMRLDSKKETQS